MSKIVTPVGSPVEKLKEVFGLGQVPLASNFSDLIDVADVGRKAAGLSPEQPAGQGQGMQLDENLKLAVLPKVDGGINVDASGVGIAVETNKGLTVGPAGLAVTPGNGIKLDTAGVGVAVVANRGLAVGTDGLAIMPGSGISLGAAGVGVAVAANMGLTVGADGLALKPGSGISLGTAGVGVSANAGRAILVDSGGVGINYDPTLQVTNNKLGVSDSALQRRTLSTTLNTSTAIWKQVMRIGANQAYAQVYITSLGGQRFVLTVCCDANTGYGTTYSVSLTNVYRGSVYGIGSVRIGYDWYGITCVDVCVTDTTHAVPLSMNYSVSDIQGVQLCPFVDLIYNGGNQNRNIGVIGTGSNGSIQGT
ncbi:hypothetical protein KBJ94_29250 [Pseudomonas sp. ITA]|uniref:hypothetical protein n=1 Tax=Pseudomonas sp. ITA TaxID=2825841 RepID=UPI0024985D70|nr:hypothetical protein [Pseudomonas sp. ITA]MDI2146137.1 hypothetical protein [Pseudomonas sp. ITA]